MIMHHRRHRLAHVLSAGDEQAQSSTIATAEPKTDRPHMERLRQRDKTESRAEGMRVVMHRHDLRVTRVLSLVFLSLAITLITYEALLEWALDTYAWPRVEVYTGQIIDYPMQPGMTLLAVALATIILVGKEILVKSEVPKLIVNTSAVIALLGYSVLYIVAGSVPVLVTAMQLLASPHITAGLSY